MADIDGEISATPAGGLDQEIKPMTDTATRWLPIAEAAAAMGISIRTIQRRAKAGEIKTMAAGHRVLIAVDDIDTDGRQAGELTRLIKHAETTEKIAMAAMAVLERERTDLLAEVDRHRRAGQVARWSAVAATVAAVAGVTYGVTTVRHRDLLAADLDDAAAKIEQVQDLLVAETACRIEAEINRDKLAAAVADDLLLMADR